MIFGRLHGGKHQPVFKQASSSREASTTTRMKLNDCNSLFCIVALCLVLLSLSVSADAAALSPVGQKRTKPKNYEVFCRAYPLHRWCMGAFAAGGKRSITDYPEQEIKPELKNPVDEETYDDMSAQIDPKTLRLILYLLKSSQDNNRLSDRSTNEGRRLAPSSQYLDAYDNEADDDGSSNEPDETATTSAKNSLFARLLNKIASSRTDSRKHQPSPTNIKHFYYDS